MHVSSPPSPLKRKRTHRLSNLIVFFVGVLMWEIFTEGRMPFEKNTNYEVVTMVTRGHRLHRPKLASKYLYEVMLRCWQEVRLFLCVVWSVETIHS